MIQLIVYIQLFNLTANFGRYQLNNFSNLVKRKFSISRIHYLDKQIRLLKSINKKYSLNFIHILIKNITVDVDSNLYTI